MNFDLAECSICLEPVAKSVSCASTLCCSLALYHEACILKWLSHSNSCPTCRKPYLSITVGTGLAVRLVHVPNRVLENDAIDQIPPQYVVSAGARPAAEIESSIHSDGVCSICSSSDYLSSILNMMGCDFCGTHFHLSCLGITASISSWCCPICDHTQNFIASAPVSRSARLPARAHLGGTGRRPPAPKVASARKGLVLTNDQDELDDDFLYEPATEMHCPVINGGVLQRKEKRAEQKLTREEWCSWSAFEHARKQGLSDDTLVDEPALVMSSAPRKKRRKPPHVETVTVPLLSAPSSSRLNSLLLQFKSKGASNVSRELYRDLHAQEQISPNTPNTQTRTPSHQLVESRPIQCSGGEAPEPTPPLSQNGDKPQLTLDQKLVILRHVRACLRPHYQSQDGRHTVIRSEEEFIALNKAISRKIYLEVMHMDRIVIAPDSAVLKTLVERNVGSVINTTTLKMI